MRPGFITTYHSLNPSTIDELHEDPSPLEFMRYVSQNRPFVVRRGASDFLASKKWNVDYLISIMGSQDVNVAITPHGNADSVLDLGDGRMAFVKPFETQEPFSDVLRRIQEQESMGEAFDGPTRYAQTQNDNLRNEYMALFADVPQSIPFARIALQKPPDAINFWLGNSKSVTALHKDNYENVYVQICGRKHFVLLPPVDSACVNEKAVLAATYRPLSSTSSSNASSPISNQNDLVVQVDKPDSYVPFATWDPDAPSRQPTKFSQFAEPMRVTLDEGDMLYLPALWYHKVSQSCSGEGICVAVNYWYDLDFSGGFWSMASFARGVGLLAGLESSQDNVRGQEAGEGSEVQITD